MHGGFALVTGDVGAGKSAALRMLAQKLAPLREVIVGEVTRPQSRVTNFYREIGDLFGVPVSSSNRWGAYKTVRAKWQEHIQQTLFRPVLLVDEAQEMSPMLLAELRLLGSTKLDTCTIVTVVLCGDRRLEEKLRTPDLLPVASRIRTRLVLDAEPPDVLGTMLRHSRSPERTPNACSLRQLCRRRLHDWTPSQCARGLARLLALRRHLN